MPYKQVRCLRRGERWKTPVRRIVSRWLTAFLKILAAWFWRFFKSTNLFLCHRGSPCQSVGWGRKSVTVFCKWSPRSSRVFRHVGLALVVMFGLAFCVLPVSNPSTLGNYFHSFLDEMVAFLSVSTTQWMGVGCATIYLVWFIYIRIKRDRCTLAMRALPAVWMLWMILAIIVDYLLSYPKSADSTQALILVSGAALSQGTMEFIDRRKENCKIKSQIIWMFLIVSFLVALLTGASLCRGTSSSF